jgi:hypothetical protein
VHAVLRFLVEHRGQIGMRQRSEPGRARSSGGHRTSRACEYRTDVAPDRLARANTAALGRTLENRG